MQRSPLLTTAERRFPEAHWVLVEGDHGEQYVVSSRARRKAVWEENQAIAVAAELVAVLAVQTRRTRATDIRLAHSSRAYVAVEAGDEEWIVVDAFMRSDDPKTLPFDPPK